MEQRMLTDLCVRARRAGRRARTEWGSDPSTAASSTMAARPHVARPLLRVSPLLPLMVRTQEVWREGGLECTLGGGAFQDRLNTG